VGERLPAASALRLARECIRLKSVIDRTGAEVVSSFLMRSHLVALLTKQFLAPRLRVVLNIHEHWTDSTPYLYPKARDRAVMRWVTRTFFPRADRIVVVAAELRRDLVENHGLLAERISVAHNPLDIARIRSAARQPLPDAYADLGDRPMIVAVGRLVRLKAIDLLVEAFARVRPGTGAELVIVGDGDERPALERLTRKLGVAGGVRFVGWQTNPWSFMGRARALALTSHTEAFPSVLTEALVLGTPTLATSSSAGVRECVDNGACGLLVKPGNVEAIAAGLRRLLADESLRAELSARGREWVKPYALTAAVRNYEAILRHVRESGAQVPARQYVAPGERMSVPAAGD
jgi:glycosyltransferase involved in cell wall biosynthesis